MSDKKSFSKTEILQCCAGELAGVGYPRLPMPNMLMLDRVINISDEGGKYGLGEIDGEFEVDPGSWFFACHFIDDPVMPGSLALDALCQLLGFYLGWRGYKGKGRAFGVGEVKYRGEILPTSGTVSYHLDIKKLVKHPVLMAIADGDVLLKDRIMHTAKSIRVGIIPDAVNYNSGHF